MHFHLCLVLLFPCFTSALSQKVDEVEVDPECTENPVGVQATEVLGGCEGGTLIKISTSLRNPLYEVCHDKSSGQTLWTKHWIDKNSVEESETSKLRIKKNQFKKFPDNKIKGLYSKVAICASYPYANQKVQFVSIFGEAKARKYLDNSSGKKLYLSKGHLTPNADFSGFEERKATFLYINAHPQWLIINKGNWYEVEKLVRQMAKKITPHLTIYTGTYGVQTYPTTTTEIWLGRPLKGKPIAEKQLPVNKFTWKIVLLGEETPTAGVVFVTINNPHVTKDEATKAVFCKDVCDEFGLDSDLKNTRKISDKGYTFCCHVKNFIAVVNNVKLQLPPDLPLLTYATSIRVSTVSPKANPKPTHSNKRLTIINLITTRPNKLPKTNRMRTNKRPIGQ